MSDRTSLTPRQLGVAVTAVVAGGAIGTLLRAVILAHTTLSTAQPNPDCGYVLGVASHCAAPQWWDYVPWSLLIINLVGVYFATWLLSGPLKHHDPANRERLFFITGVFGGFTSYSSLYVALGTMWAVYPLGALLAGVSALLSGAFAAWFGLKSHR